MPTTCQFKFSRTTPIYYSGEQINGCVVLSTTKQLPIEAIQLSLICIEHVQWLERSKNELLSHNDSIEKDNKVLYIGKRETSIESFTLAKKVRLQPVDVRIEEFQFRLPSYALASCEMKYGEVVYYIQLTLQRKSVFNKIYKARITVKNRLDLNEVLKLAKQEEAIIANATPTPAEPLRFTLPKGLGYVPGQTISYTLKGRHTFGACNKLYVNLCQRSTFHATSPNTKQKELCQILKSDIQKIGLSSSYLNTYGQLCIPLITHISVNGNGSDLIQLCHYVEATLFYKKRILQKFYVPILIGTVPLKSDSATHEEEVDDFHCYDNLATDAITEKSESENDCLRSDAPTFLSTSSSPFILNSLATSSPNNMCQQHVAATCYYAKELNNVV